MNLKFWILLVLSLSLQGRSHTHPSALPVFYKVVRRFLSHSRVGHEEPVQQSGPYELPVLAVLNRQKPERFAANERRAVAPQRQQLRNHVHRVDLNVVEWVNEAKHRLFFSSVRFGSVRVSFRFVSFRFGKKEKKSTKQEMKRGEKKMEVMRQWNKEKRENNERANTTAVPEKKNKHETGRKIEIKNEKMKK